MTGAPLVCTLTRGEAHGGIARVSELLWRAVCAITNRECQRLSLFPTDATELTFATRLAYARALVAAQLADRPPWILFDHLGIARPQVLVPSPLRAPYTVFLHSLEVWRPLPQHRKRALLNAEFLIANSQYTADRTRSFHPDLPQIHVCHLALDQQPAGDDGDQDRDLVRRVAERSVLIVGRMVSVERHKGHDQLLEVWSDVVSRVPSAQLVVAGQGDDAARFQRKARELGVDRSVLFTGKVSESTLHALYERAAVFAMPSRAEGFGLVYLEAMSHRLPVIASTVDAASEIVVDGETGFLIDPDDRGALADRLVRLLEDASVRRRFGQAGYARWQARFSYERFQARLSEILGTLMTPPVTPRPAD
jgi:glycosyltransferase involved in cell wall biosynthesis